MRCTAAIFDMDGTILNTLEDLTDSLNHALAETGFPGRSIDEVRAFLGNGIPRLVELGVPAGTDAARQAEVLAAFNRYYAVHCGDKTRPYDGITEVIRRLREDGVKTAVVSNKADYAVQILCREYFAGLFDEAVGLRDGIRKKPYPDAVNAVLTALGIDRREAVYIGDSEVDVHTAENAGMALVAVDWGFRSRQQLTEAGARVIVSDAAGLLAQLR